MTYIIYTVVSLNQKDKIGFINWLKDEHDVPTKKPDIADKSDNICLDDRVIYLAIYEKLEKVLLESYCKENNTDVGHTDFSNVEFYGYCSIKYNSIEKTIKIPLLKKDCPTNINDLNQILEGYKYDRLLLLLLMKKLLAKNKKKTFYQLNFDLLNFDELFRSKLYDCHSILSYYNIALLSPEDIIELIKYWQYHINYSIEWRHKNNNYMFINRYKKMVHKLKISELICYKLAKTDYKFKNTTLKTLHQQIAFDDWVNIIDINTIYDGKINSLKKLDEIFELYVFKVFKPSTDLESSILGCCNKYAEDNNIKCRDYTKIKKMIKKKFSHRQPNLIIECLEYSQLHKKSKKIKLFKCCC